VRGVPRAGQDNGELQRFFGPGTLSLPKGGADFEQADIALALAPVKFDCAASGPVGAGAEVCLILRSGFWTRIGSGESAGQRSVSASSRPARASCSTDPTQRSSEGASGPCRGD